jgi:hypothetical protein
MVALVLLVPVALASETTTETGEDGSSNGATPTISVGRMLFCRSIKEREPQETAARFPNDIELVYCFTVIENAGAEATQVTHKWYWGDKLMGSVQLKAQGEYWRTWSLKHLQPEWTGTWRVDVVSVDGKVLKSASFEVVTPEAMQQSPETDTGAGEADTGDAGGEDDSDKDTGGSGSADSENGTTGDIE